MATPTKTDKPTPMKSLPAALAEAAATHSTAPALLGSAGTHTFASLAEASRAFASALAALGVNKGTHVGILLPNQPSWLVTAWAVWRLGGTIVPLNTLWTAPELQAALDWADVHLLVAIPRFLKHDYVAALRSFGVEPHRRQTRASTLPCLHTVVWTDPDGSVQGRCESASTLTAGAPSPDWLAAQEHAVEATDVAAIFFTSGSEGTPKAVVHTHRSILAAAQGISERLGLGPTDRVWAYLPWFFAGGLVAGVLAPWLVGAGVIYQHTFDPGEAIALMERFQATTFFAWPHQAQAIVNHPAFSRQRLRLHKGPGAQAGWAKALYGEDHTAVSSWGMTETGPMAATTAWSDPLERRCSTHGRPLPGVEMRVVDPTTGANLPAGREGELLVRGTTVMASYYKKRARDCFDTDGFFHTGDRAFLDSDGYLHFLGRLRDVIKVAGANVSPAEVEQVLHAYPGVRSAAIVGIPHPERGETIVAFLVPKPEQHLDQDQLGAFCRHHLAAYKVPRHFFILTPEEWPELGSGKVDKSALRQRARRLLGLV